MDQNSEENNSKKQERIVSRVVEDEMKQSYLDYSMSVIVGRALPDVRDGLKPVHRRILFAMNDMGMHHNKPFKKSARIVGECFVKGTKILTEKGLIPIENIEKGDVVCTQNSKNKVKQLYEMPEKELMNVKLMNGISVTVTPSQKLKIVNRKLEFEWKEAKNLTPNDFLILKAEYPEIDEQQYLGDFKNKKIYLNEGIGYLLGQFLSDGWVEKGCIRGYPFRLGFCSTSEPVMSKIASILQREFNYDCTLEEKKSTIEDDGRILILKNIYTIRINNSLLNQLLVSKFVLQNAFAATKEIPQEIMRSPANVVYAFISGLIDGDGSVHKERNMVHYGSVSEKLIDQLQVLLQHLGIFSQKYTNNKLNKNRFSGREIKATLPFHYLEISSIFAQSLARKLSLAEEIKASRLKNIGVSTTMKISAFDTVPYLAEVVFGELSQKHLGGGWYSDVNGKRFRSGIKYKTGSKIRYSTDLKKKSLAKSQIIDWGIRKKLGQIGSPTAKLIDNIIDGNLYFLKVQGVEKAAAEKTYDLEVEDAHEFVANGIVSHNCLGKYHPHGDLAVYDALVRMAQDFSLRYPLINGQGNWGSIDGDASAAMRYTEARLNKLAEELLQDIEKETVKFVDNFDSSLKEPTVLPSKIPNLLINGSSGIAVGMATNIPPHNISEVSDGIIAAIDDPNITTEKLMCFIRGPDFPTGASILGLKGIKQAYETGKGSVIVRAKTIIEEKKERKNIIVNEISYQVNKSIMIEQIAGLIRDKSLVGVSDLRDESDRDGMRVVIELKKDANPEVILNQLYKHTSMQTTFGIIMLALVNNEPKVLSLKGMVQHFIKHRQDVVRKRTEFDFKEAEKKAHILEGLIIALNDIDNVIQKIKKSKDAAEAKIMLIADYRLTEVQSLAILDMRLQRLASLEQEKIKNDHKDLLGLIEALKAILADENKILSIIKEELIEIKNNYGDKRRTQIEESAAEEICTEDLVKPEEMVVTITHEGYIKRLSVNAYKLQRRGGHGVIGAGKKEEDFIEDLFIANTHSYILFFTNKGKVHWLKVYEIPEASKMAKGTAVINLLDLDKGEKVSAFVPVREFDDQHYIVFATKKGTVKKTNLAEYSRPRVGGIIAITLEESDELINTSLTDGKQQIILATKNGLAVRFKEEDVRATGRSAQGVRGARLRQNDEIVGMVIGDDSKTLLTVTENGYGKRTQISEYRLVSRGGVGVRNILCSERNSCVVAVKSIVDDDELIFISKNGIVIRTKAAGISVIGRATQGMKIMKLEESDKLVAAARIVKEENGENQNK